MPTSDHSCYSDDLSVSMEVYLMGTWLISAWLCDECAERVPVLVTTLN